MPLCGNDICNKPGTLRCSKCKKIYYCSASCQKTSWKQHKKSCTQLNTESVQDSTSNICPVSDYRQILPEFHKEYKMRYPDDLVGFAMLMADYTAKNVVRPLLDFNGTIKQYGSQLDCLTKRWTVYGNFLYNFLETAKLGDIFDFLDRPEVIIKKQGNLLSNYYTMRNVPVHVMDVEIGKTYVNIGYVDLQQIMFSNISNPQNEGQVTWFCVEANAICLARSMVILELIKTAACSARDILQIWYSTSIGSDAVRALKRCCRNLAEKEESVRLKKLFSFWSTAKLNGKDAREEWSMKMFEIESTREIILDMENMLDRQETARYLVTGEIFLNNAQPIYGNVTMFLFPQEFSIVRKIEDNMFASLDLEMLPPTINSFVSSVEELFITKMEKFQSLLKDNKITVSLNYGIISKDHPKLLTPIQLLLKPAVIDWSNIPDYWTNQDFFDVAKMCSVKTTKHRLHLMNWTSCVYGCNIMDYMPVDRDNLASIPFQDKSGKIAMFYKSLENEYCAKEMKDSEHVLKPLHIKSKVPNLMNLSEKVLCRRYIDKYVTYFFRNQNCVEKVAKVASYTPFSSSNTLIEVSFKFGESSHASQCPSDISFCNNIGCKMIGTKTCARCKYTKYCSVDCQKASWEEHKLICRTVKQ